MTYCDDPYACAQGADALVIVTEWEQFRALDFARLKAVMARPVVVDLRNIYRRRGDGARYGFTYVSVGRPAEACKRRGVFDEPASHRRRAARPDRGAAAAQCRRVLVAPPGAGKTTRVPLVLADEPWAAGKKILVLEPRRLAARAAADRMAATLRRERSATRSACACASARRCRARTRIEVVTEGVFTRLILDDPALDGVAAVLFDEFHERSLDADLGLALARDAQQGLREDLKLLVMSATLDGARVASCSAMRR